MLGAQSRNVFWKELDGCDILVAPSRTGPDGDSEGGAPTVLLEAQAAGVPIVTTNHADIPFVLAPGGSAVVARENDPAAVAEAINECILNSSQWPDRGEAARRFVAEKHDISAVAGELDSLYERLLKESTGRWGEEN
jgi:colanic acid/amylovoran biosynthesis glycosyltransferase